MKRLKLNLFPIVLVIVMTFLCMTESYALDRGFYPRGSNPSKFKELKECDRVLNVRELDEIDIGLHTDIGNPIFFKRVEILDFLKNERHKNLLVVRFEKYLTFRSSKGNNPELENFKLFLRETGYSRVVILGSHSVGFSVIDDLKYNPKVVK